MLLTITNKERKTEYDKRKKRNEKRNVSSSNYGDPGEYTSAVDLLRKEKKNMKTQKIIVAIKNEVLPLLIATVFAIIASLSFAPGGTHM